MTSHRSESFLFFAAGVVVTLVASKVIERRRKLKEHAGATVEGDDLSLFYDDDIPKLTEITKSRKFLPSDFYGAMVRDCIVCCCDIIVVRTNKQTRKKETLLVERSSEPVKGVWWWPGGRILKGETFFAAATRKAIQETGISNVKPIQVVGIWNTFFPTSHWDTDTEKGTQTVNAVVLVEMTNNDTDNDTTVKLDNTSEQYKWISLDPEEAIKNNEDPYVWRNLQRLKAWNPSY